MAKNNFPQRVLDIYEAFKKDPVGEICKKYGEHAMIGRKNFRRYYYGGTIFFLTKRYNAFSIMSTNSEISFEFSKNAMIYDPSSYRIDYMYPTNFGKKYNSAHINLPLAICNEGKIYGFEVEINCKNDVPALSGIILNELHPTLRQISTMFASCDITETNVSPLKQIDKVVPYINILCDDQYPDLDDMCDHVYPYSASTRNSYDIPAALFMMAPQLELLAKAGYPELVRSAVNGYDSSTTTDIDRFNRLCKRGHDMKTIFCTDSMLYKTLKGKNATIETWDYCRKLAKQNKANQYTLELLSDGRFSSKQLDNIYSILKFVEPGASKPLFDLNKLFDYLHKLDMFEALETDIAIQYLADYLRCCATLHIRPKIDSDSLMREHNIAARLCRMQRNEQTAKAMIPKCRELQKNDWSDGDFFIRGITSYDDLFREASMQSNCLAGYANSIAKGTAKIYVMRRKDTPERALVSVELSLDEKTIRQKLLSHNRPIADPAMTDFLNRWLAVVKSGQATEWDDVETEVSRVISRQNNNFYDMCCKVYTQYIRTGDLHAAVEKCAAGISSAA